MGPLKADDRAPDQQSYRITTLLMTILLIGSVVVPPSVLAAQQPDADAEEALETRDRALDKLQRLEELDDAAAVSIDRSVKQSIRDQINQGNISYRDENYSAAIAHYESAISQSKGSLTRAYTTQAGLLLNSSASHLQKLDESGYNRAEVSTFQRRREALEQRRQSVSSFVDARDVYNEAETLHGDVEEMPDPNFIRFVNGFYTVVIPLQVILTLVGGLFGAAIMRWLSDSPEEDGDTGTGGGETFTPTRMD